MAVEGEESHQYRPRLFAAGKGPGYVGKTPDQQLAQEWPFAGVVALARSVVVEEPVRQKVGLKYITDYILKY